MNKAGFFIVLFAIAQMVFFLGCGGDSSNGEMGEMSVNLVDASTDEYQAVYVTIDEVKVHIGDGEEDGDDGGGWVTVASPQQTYNLLELVNGMMENLGMADLETGIYTQMRLYLGTTPDDSENILNESHLFPNYVIDADDSEIHELKVPSGYQSGVKLVHEAEIVSGRTVELVLDFDANSSVVKAGDSGQYLLKPTITVVDTIDNAVLSGVVTDVGQAALGGATVSAQKYDATAGDEKDKVVVYASTITDEFGAYTMYLEPGVYNVVASTSGRDTLCAEVNAEFDGLYTHDFVLLSTDSGTVHIDVAITDGDEAASATLSLRREGQCSGGIEVTATNVVAGGYDIDLPEGSYKLVATSENRTTQVKDVVIDASATVTVEVLFP